MSGRPAADAGRGAVGRLLGLMQLPPELANRPARKAGQEPSATLTLDAYSRLKGELDDLKTNGRAYIAERLKVAREHGDLRENADYDAAKNDQALMESRIRNLDRMLRDPEIVEAPVGADEATPGMLVTLRPLDEDEPEDETYLLAESAEERAPGVRTITTTSPLGQALAGKRLDDELEVEAPGGTFRYLVVGLKPRE
jgi:transcription elongation factor GreA